MECICTCSSDDDSDDSEDEDSSDSDDDDDDDEDTEQHQASGHSDNLDSGISSTTDLQERYWKQETVYNDVKEQIIYKVNGECIYMGGQGNGELGLDTLPTFWPFWQPRPWLLHIADA